MDASYLIAAAVFGLWMLAMVGINRIGPPSLAYRDHYTPDAFVGHLTDER